MANPSKTLSKILSTIQKDVNKISKLAKVQQLTPSEAKTLCQYASTLHDIIEVKEKDQQQAKKKLDKLDTNTLIDMYKDEQAKKSPKGK